MDLDIYDEWAQQELVWARNQLVDEGIEALRASYEQLGEPALRAFLAEHRSEIDALFHVPHDQREPMIHQFSSETERHAFLLCSEYTARSAALLLDAATTCGFSASAAGRQSKAFLMLQAAQIVLDIEAHMPMDIWPFDDEE